MTGRASRARRRVAALAIVLGAAAFAPIAGQAALAPRSASPGAALDHAALRGAALYGVAPTDPSVADLVATLKSLGASEQDIADLAAATDLDGLRDWIMPATGASATATGPDIRYGTNFELKASADVAAAWFAPGGPLAAGTAGVVSPVTKLNGAAGMEWYVYAANMTEPFAGEPNRRVEAGIAALDTTPIAGGAVIRPPQQGAGDFFGGMNVAWSTRSENGGPFAIHHFQAAQAGGFNERPTDAVSVINGRVLLTLIPEVEATDFESSRAFSFAGGLDFTPASIAVDTYPDMAQAPRAGGNVPVIEITGATETPGPTSATPAAATATPAGVSPAPSVAGGGPTATTSGAPPWPLLVGVGVLLAIAGGWMVLRGGPAKAAAGGGPAVVQVTDLKPPPDQPPVTPPAEQPGLAPPPPPTTSRPDPCTCSCTAKIEGPFALNVCPCDKLTFRITGAGSTTGTLQAVREDGSIAFSKQLRCRVTMTCQGAEAGEVAADWSLTRAGDTLTITATGRGQYRCEGSSEARTCTCVAPPFQIRLLPGSGCIVEVVTLVLGWDELIGHVAVRLTCGETDELWGYFPKDRSSLLAPFKGTPGSVDHRSASTGQVDQIGKEYSGYYCKNGKRVWAIQLTCDQCEKLRKFWENLEKNPGEYVLASSNCATRALDSLHAAGVKLNMPGPYDENEDYQWSSDAYRPGLVEDLMNQLAGEGGASQVLEIEANPNCTSDH